MSALSRSTVDSAGGVSGGGVSGGGVNGGGVNWGGVNGGSINWGGVIGVIGRVPCLLSCGVHVAGENVNSDDSDEDDESSSRSVAIGVLSCVEEGTKRSSSSRSMLDIGWRGASLVQFTIGN